MAYYGSTAINQGAAGLGVLGIVPRAQEAVRRKDILSVVAPPFAMMMGLGQEEVVVVEEPVVTSIEPGEPSPSVLPGEFDYMPGEPGSYPVPLPPPPPPPPTQWQTLGKILSYVGGVGGAYHGYKRNESAGWAFGWFIFGSVLPIFAIPVALAQGFAKPKRT